MTKPITICPDCGYEHTVEELDRDAGPFCIKCGADMELPADRRIFSPYRPRFEDRVNPCPVCGSERCSFCGGSLDDIGCIQCGMYRSAETAPPPHEEPEEPREESPAFAGVYSPGGVGELYIMPDDDGHYRLYGPDFIINLDMRFRGQAIQEAVEKAAVKQVSRKPPTAPEREGEDFCHCGNPIVDGECVLARELRERIAEVEEKREGEPWEAQWEYISYRRYRCLECGKEHHEPLKICPNCGVSMEPPQGTEGGKP